VETVARIECLECKTAVLMKARPPGAGEASILVLATNVKLPCGHDCSDVRRWAGFVAEVTFETAT
jgi:DNA-directed RNA polymerase subunit RPC12/RpoP